MYPGAQLAAIHGLTDLLLTVNRVAVSEGLDMAPVSVSHWQIPQGAAVPVRVFASSQHRPDRLAALAIPPLLQGPPSPDLAAPYLSWLRAEHRAGVVLAAICAGTFLLAETGLLDGRGATTHWMHGDSFRQRFPKVRLDVDQLLTDEGTILTAGGVMAWTDLGLRMVERFCGAEAMIATARALLIDPPGREQRFYSKFLPPTDHGDHIIRKAQDHLHAAHGKDVALEALLDCTGLEERTFLRRFRAATGLTTTHYAQKLKISRAQDMLRQSSSSIDQIAWDVGYSDPAAFRKTFTRIVGLSPTGYRRRLSTRFVVQHASGAEFAQ